MQPYVGLGVSAAQYSNLQSSILWEIIDSLVDEVAAEQDLMRRLDLKLTFDHGMGGSPSALGKYTDVCSKIDRLAAKLRQCPICEGTGTILLYPDETAAAREIGKCPHCHGTKVRPADCQPEAGYSSMRSLLHFIATDLGIADGAKTEHPVALTREIRGRIQSLMPPSAAPRDACEDRGLMVTSRKPTRSNMHLTEEQTQLIHNVASDAANMLECNCSGDCDGLCTNAMARKVVAMLQEDTADDADKASADPA